MADTPQVTIVLNARGQMVGPKDHVPDSVMAQLADPAIQAQLRAQYKKAFSSGRRESRREPKIIFDAATQRCDYRSLAPKEMSKRERNRMRKSTLRQWTKKELKAQRIARRLNNVIQSVPDSGHAESGSLAERSAVAAA